MAAVGSSCQWFLSVVVVDCCFYWLLLSVVVGSCCQGLLSVFVFGGCCRVVIKGGCRWWLL